MKKLFIVILVLFVSFVLITNISDSLNLEACNCTGLECDKY